MARVFLSHSSRDNEAAVRMKAWLEAQHFEAPFLDFDKHAGIPPGADWEKKLYDEIRRSQALLILQTPNWSASRWCFAEFTQARALGKPVFQVIEDDDGADEAPIAGDRQRLDLRSDRESGLAALRKELIEIAEQAQGGFAWPPPNDRSRSPYPGMVEFQEEDAAVFFGRDGDWRAVIDKLNSRRVQGGPRLLVLQGSSGAGKSSLLRAGVLPRLRRAGKQWLLVPPLRPQAKPLEALAKSWAVALRRAGEWRGLHQQLQEAARSDSPATLLQKWAEDLQMAASAPEAQILLGIDQGEELFTVAEAEEKQGFLAVLGAALSQPLPLQAVMTIRADSVGELQQVASLVNRLETLPLGPLPMERYREIIEGPAKVAGLTVEEAFVAQAVRHTETEDALPLLAVALRNLYEQSGGNGNLSLSAYQQLGDLAAGLTPLENAVRRIANDALLYDIDRETELPALRKAFIGKMVRLTAEGTFRSCVAGWDDLPSAAYSLLDRLVEKRLLVRRQAEGEESTLEIAHEAMLRTWPTLKGWLEEARMEFYERLRVDWLCHELDPESQPEQKARKGALEQLARMAAKGAHEKERRAVKDQAGPQLQKLLQNQGLSTQERQDVALVLALIGKEMPLQQLLADLSAPVQVRRAAAEALGLIAADDGQCEQIREKIIDNLRQQMKRKPLLKVMVKKTKDWEKIDAVLPVLQGAARGLQLAASRELPLLGMGKGRMVPMLTLTALNKGVDKALEVRTEVLEEVQVWRLPLPEGQQLEMVLVPGGEYTIGSPLGSPDGEEDKKKCYSGSPESEHVDKEPMRMVRLGQLAMARFSITQAQWEAVAGQEPGLKTRPGSFKSQGLWELYGQPGCLPVDSVSWNDCQEWLARLNRWLAEHWRDQGHAGEAPELRLPGEGEWEAACRAESDTPFHFGDTLDPSWANYAHIDRSGVGRTNETYPQRPRAIGSHGLVNLWGLADMHGQLYEWCGDLWHPSPLGGPKDGSPWEDPDPSPEAAPRADNRVLRGGSWINFPRKCRSAFRYCDHPAFVDPYFGFRPCCLLPPAPFIARATGRDSCGIT